MNLELFLATKTGTPIIGQIAILKNMARLNKSPVFAGQIGSLLAAWRFCDDPAILS